MDQQRRATDLETRVANLESALLLQHSTLKRLFNHEIALHALAISLTRQPRLDPCQLLEDFEALMIASFEQLEPGQQVPEAFEEISTSLRRLCRNVRG